MEALPPLSESIVGQPMMPSIVRTVMMMEPTDDQRSYTVMAYDENDRLLATTEEAALDDALPAMADKRLGTSDEEAT